MLIPITGTLTLYTFGLVGDIRLFMHIAAFSSLPLLIWFVIGNQAAKIIVFPLKFNGHLCIRISSIAIPHLIN